MQSRDVRRVSFPEPSDLELSAVQQVSHTRFFRAKYRMLMYDVL
jgi:hypothetical protein